MTNPPQKPLTGLRILVVEDAVSLALGTADWLHELGAMIDVRASVVQAKKRLIEAPFDMVVIDYHLAGSATGTDLAVWMRDHPDLQQIVRVSLSGTEPQHILQCSPTGAYHLV